MAKMITNGIFALPWRKYFSPGVWALTQGKQCHVPSLHLVDATDIPLRSININFPNKVTKVRPHQRETVEQNNHTPTHSQPRRHSPVDPQNDQWKFICCPDLSLPALPSPLLWKLHHIFCQNDIVAGDAGVLCVRARACVWEDRSLVT